VKGRFVCWKEGGKGKKWQALEAQKKRRRSAEEAQKKRRRSAEEAQTKLGDKDYSETNLWSDWEM
jgi:hypothetical protein